MNNILKAMALKWVIIIGVTHAMRKAAQHMDKP